VETTNQTNVLAVCRDLHSGGAARGTARILSAIRAHESDRVTLEIRTALGGSNVSNVTEGLPGGASRLARGAARRVSRIADRLPWSTKNRILHSRADVWTGLAREINRRDPDVVNLHWLGTGTLSVQEIGAISSPIVWTLTDMWAFCGSEHYASDGRFSAGYLPGNRPTDETGLDWNRIVWKQKMQHWRRPMHIVAKSRWLADCARRSALMGSWPISVIPNPIDLQFWAPVEQAAARDILSIPRDCQVITFGAVGGDRQPIKGGDLLFDALRRLSAMFSNGSRIHLVIFGDDSPGTKPVDFPFPVHRVGRLSDDRLLKLAYSAADAVVVPSRADNLPNTAIEAQACGVPVVAFRVGGLPDIVEDGVTGRLVDPFDVHQLALAIAWVLEDENRQRHLGREARSQAGLKFDPRIVASQYAEVFAAVADGQLGSETASYPERGPR
jgi:glycosyltransferase involved in cell wall biosynthesis